MLQSRFPLNFLNKFIPFISRNITLTDIYYFWFAPTLTYQIAYPRLVRRNWLRIFTLVARLFLTNVLILFLVAQVVSPNLKSLTQDLESGKHVFSVEIFVGYLLKLAIACTYIWLLVFYAYFHLFFNILAELLKFGDRVFYKDWWNSSNVSSYWRLWNLPVHYWLGKFDEETYIHFFLSFSRKSDIL